MGCGLLASFWKEKFHLVVPERLAKILRDLWFKVRTWNSRRPALKEKSPLDQHRQRRPARMRAAKSPQDLSSFRSDAFSWTH